MRRRFHSAHPQGSDRANIDVNPLLDVVFILLIFFIVTSVFIREQGLDLSQKPPSETTPPEPQRPLVIAIDARDQIWLNRKPVDIRRVEANLARLHAEQPEAPLVVDADSGSSVDALVRVIDQARKAGIEDVGLTD